MERRAVNWIFFGLFSITLYVQTNLADPFNSPKFWILMLTAAWLAGFIISFRYLVHSDPILRNLYLLVTVYLLALIIATVFTDFKYTAVFGESGRRNGFLTYASLAIFLCCASLFIRFVNITRLLVLCYIMGTLSAVYGYIQSIGKDFIEWNNPYNSIITTAGNPNFSAALMAILAVMIFSSIFNVNLNLVLRVYGVFLVLFLLLVIYKSEARQGLLSFILGAGVFSIILLIKFNKKIGFFFCGIASLIFIFSVLGMLQKGPLVELLYKPSVSVRGFYWRAAFEMLQSSPFVGVGIDRYGGYFKEFREAGYPLNYGFNLTSTNAHNTFLQQFATGGFLLGMSYLALNAYILKCAISGLKKAKSSNLTILAGIFSAWIAFHAQSLVSIDNISVSIWGWVLGGIIIGCTINLKDSDSGSSQPLLRSKSDLNSERIIVSSLLFLPALILVALLYQGESNYFKTQINFNLQDVNTKQFFKDQNLNALNTILIDPYYKYAIATNLINGGFTQEGVAILEGLHKNDPRNMDAINTLAVVNEELANYENAIKYRLKMSIIDEWNAANYINLGLDYKQIGQIEKSQEMLEKIMSFASDNSIAKKAQIELGSN